MPNVACDAHEQGTPTCHLAGHERNEDDELLTMPFVGAQVLTRCEATTDPQLACLFVEVRERAGW
jgi:hypothetical protein